MTFLFLIICFTNCGEAGKSSGERNKLSDTLSTTKSNRFVISDSSRPKNTKSADMYYPFELQDFNGQHNIVANIEAEGLYPKYYDFFKKHGYEGNGYCWEGHIIQILEKLDKTLLTQLDFDPESGTFFAIAKTKEAQLKFVELLSPIFSDLKKLDEWVRKADHSRIDD
jgi:hypothetical protein